jgi:hypothetical protein
MDQQHVIIGKDISPQLAATALLRQNGFTISQAAEALDISSRQVVNRTNQLPKNLCIDSRKRIRGSAKAVDLVLQSAPNVQYKGSDVVSVIKEVYSRAQPVKSQDQQTSVSYTQVNINLYGT